MSSCWCNRIVIDIRVVYVKIHSIGGRRRRRIRSSSRIWIRSIRRIRNGRIAICRINTIISRYRNNSRINSSSCRSASRCRIGTTSRIINIIKYRRSPTSYTWYNCYYPYTS